MTSNFLLDSCIWIGYFTADTPKAKEIIESNNNKFTSVLTIFEISSKLNKMNIPKTIIQNIIETIEKNSFILNVNLEISKKQVTIVKNMIFLQLTVYYIQHQKLKN